jgi:hypothetical protein
LLSVPQGTEMFQFPWFPLPALCVQAGVTPHDGCRVSPFGYPRIKAWSAAPRGFSQPPTSFIGVRRQGIHRWLFVAWKNKDARARYAVLKELGHRRRRGPDMRTPAQPLGGRAGGASRDWRPGAAPSKQKTGQYVWNRFRRREVIPTIDDVARTGPNEAPTGSRSCGMQKH